MSKTTTWYNFVLPELTDPANITQTNQNWTTLDSTLAGLANFVANHKTYAANITLKYGSWNGQVYSFKLDDLSNEFGGTWTAESFIEMIPSPLITTSELEALQKANITGLALFNELSLHAHGEVPTIDIPVVLLMRGAV